MNFGRALITNISDLPGDGGAARDHQYDLLDWIASSDLLKLSVFERELQVREKYFRFAIRGETPTGESFSGFGRSPDKKIAATIAINELLERFVSRSILADNTVLAPFAVTARGGEIGIGNLDSLAKLPTPGFHSSNGWAVHFSARAAIENAAREALERHILLLSYLKNGWTGFFFDEPVPFASASVIPGIAKVEAGGFKAGIVLTTGSEAPGATFGYLCGAGDDFEKSRRWLSAFFESYEQWIDLTAKEMPATTDSVIEQYQWNYLKTPRPALPDKEAAQTTFSEVNGNLAVFDLQKFFGSPFPLYAAFVFGGDLIPLFLRQKLSSEEVTVVTEKLEKFGITTHLPEFHPIL